MRPRYDARVRGERGLAGLRRALLVAVVAVCVAATAGHVRRAAAANPVIAVDTNVFSGGVQPDGVYAAGGEVWIQTFVMNAQPTGAFEFTLSFDSGVLQFLSWSEGGFLGSTGLATACTPNITQHAVNIGCNTVGPLHAAGPSGNGALIVLRFQAKFNARTCFVLTAVETATTDGNPIPTSSQDGCVTADTLLVPPTATRTPAPPAAPTATLTPVPPPPTATWTPAPAPTPTAAPATATASAPITPTAQAPTSVPQPTMTPGTGTRTAGSSGTAAQDGATTTPVAGTSVQPTAGGGAQSGGSNATVGSVAGAADDGGSAGSRDRTPTGTAAGVVAPPAGDPAPGTAEHDVLGSSRRPDDPASDSSAAVGDSSGGGGIAWWELALGGVGVCVLAGGAFAGRRWWPRRA